MTTTTKPIVRDGGTGYAGRYMAVIYDDGPASFDQLVRTLSFATGCTLHNAFNAAWEIRYFGKSSVYFGTQVSCCAVASMMCRTGVSAEVRPEWSED